MSKTGYVYMWISFKNESITNNFTKIFIAMLTYIYKDVITLCNHYTDLLQQVNDLSMYIINWMVLTYCISFI